MILASKPMSGEIDSAKWHGKALCLFLSYRNDIDNEALEEELGLMTV